MSIPAMQAAYVRANVTGRFAQKNLTNIGLVGRAVDLAVRNRNHRGLRGLGNRIAVNACVAASTSLTYDRVLAPFPLISSLATKHVTLGLYPVAEVVFGRGTPSLGRFEDATTLSEQIHTLWRQATQHGVLGHCLETYPLRLAATAQARGNNKLAQACIAGAIVGRCALQGPRAAIALWAISETALLVAIVTSGSLFIEGVARGARWTIDQAQARRPSLPLHAVREALNRLVALLSRQAVFALAEAIRPDDLHEAPVPRGPISNQTVAERTNAAMRRFLLIEDTEADGGREVRQTADSIADDLRRYCAGAPDDSALRGGLSLLNSMMDLTYEDANWPVPPELC